MVVVTDGWGCSRYDKTHLGDNVLLDGEIDTGKAEVALSNRKKLDRQHDAKRRTAQRKLVKPRPMNTLYSQATYIDRNVAASAEIRAKLQPEALVESLQTALVFCVTDVAKPSASVNLTSAVLGGAIIDPRFFHTMGLKGCSIVRRAGHTRRQVYFTPAFVAKFPGLMACFQACCEQSSLWSRCESVDTILSFHARTPKNATAMLAVCLSAEKTTAVFKDRKWVLSFEQFIHKISLVNTSTQGFSNL